MTTELGKLREDLTSSFSLSELYDFCFDLQIDYENLRGETKNEKVVALIYLIGREQKLDQLMTELRRLRPQVAWPILSPEIKNALVYVSTEVNPLAELHRTRKEMLILLQKVRSFWVEGVLHQTILLPESLKLEMERYDQAVKIAWQTFLGQDQYDSGATPLPEGLLDIFLSMDRSLLILGAPGAGKTITLIQLAHELSVLAELDSSQPVPVILNLSSWAEKRRSLKVWIIEELAGKYQIPGRISQGWMDENRLLFLFDGLDEMELEAQATCIEAINAYRRDYGLAGTVVSSRINSYERSDALLEMGGAILLKPLTLEQITRYLDTAGDRYLSLKTMIQEDKILQELAQSPLILFIMLKVFGSEEFYASSPVVPQSAEDEEPSHPRDAEDRRQQLLEKYIFYAVSHRGKTAENVYETMKRQLKWLAKQMRQHDQSVFLVEQMQPSWLSSSVLRWLYLLMTRLIVGLMTGMFSWLLALLAYYIPREFNLEVMQRMSSFFGTPDIFRNPVTHLIFYAGFGLLVTLIDGMFFEFHQYEKPFKRRWGLIHSMIVGVCVMVILAFITALFDPLLIGILGGFIAGLYFVLALDYIEHGPSFRTEIRTITALHWSWRMAGIWLVIGIPVSLAIGAMIFLMFDWPEALIFAGSILLVSLLAGGFQGRHIEKTSFPSQGIWLTLRSALFVSIISAALAAALLGVMMQDARSGLLAGGVVFLAMWTRFGGVDLIKYGCMRLLLWRSDHIPWQFTRLLDDASDRTLLRRVGGGYLFMHSSLQAYFADMQ